MKRLMLIALSVATSLVSSGCPSNQHGDVYAMQSTGDILLSVTRSDGSVMPNLVEYIETRYGVRVQTMTVVMPTLSFDLTSSLDVTDPARFTADVAVVGWDTPSYDVFNDVQAVPMTFEVRSISEQCTGPCDFWQRIPQYVQFFDGLVRTHLPEHLRLRLIGINAVTGASDVVELTPAFLDYQCQYDEGYGYYSSAIHCAGEAQFFVE